MPPSKPLDVVLAMRRTITDPPFTHDRYGRPLIGPCLVWNGKLPKNGYPMLTHRTWPQIPQLVHRVAYALATGHPLAELWTIPTLDHLCRTPACSAFEHLEPKTRAENLAIGNPNQNERKDECDNGHPFSPENTYVRPNGNRDCRRCKRKVARESWRRKNRPDLVGKDPLHSNGRPQTVVREPKARRHWTDGT
jgi:hypothetical protein